MLLLHRPRHELRIHHHRYAHSHLPSWDFANKQTPAALRNLKLASLNPLTWFQKSTNGDEDDEDLTPEADRVPTLWWTTGLAASIILCCSILATMFHMNVGEAILSLILGFAFSFVGVQSAGTTDVNPVTAVAKVRIGLGVLEEDGHADGRHFAIGFATCLRRHWEGRGPRNQARRDGQLDGGYHRRRVCSAVYRHDR